jgi:phosphonate transport system substrate-binding protein
MCVLIKPMFRLSPLFSHQQMPQPPHSKQRRAGLCMAVALGGLFALHAKAQGRATPPLEVGVLPGAPVRQLLSQYEPLRRYLSRTLPCGAQISTAPDWASFHQRTQALDYDLVVTAPHLARLVQLERGHVPLLAVQPNTEAMLVCQSSQPLDGVAALRGQALVVANPAALATLHGLQWLAENGLQRDRDFRLLKVQGDDSAAGQVLRGAARAALLGADEWQALPAATQAQLQAFATFSDLPNLLLMASPRLATRETAALKAALQGFAAAGAEAQAFYAATGYSGLQELAPGVLESMDGLVATTRKVLGLAG